MLSRAYAMLVVKEKEKHAMGAIMLLLIVGLILWALWSLFVKSVVWTLEPLTDYIDNKDKERRDFEGAVLKKLDKIAEADKEMVGAPSVIPLAARCPKCRRQTMYYDPATSRSKCKECDSI